MGFLLAGQQWCTIAGLEKNPQEGLTVLCQLSCSRLGLVRAQETDDGDLTSENLEWSFLPARGTHAVDYENLPGSCPFVRASTSRLVPIQFMYAFWFVGLNFGLHTLIPYLVLKFWYWLRGPWCTNWVQWAKTDGKFVRTYRTVELFCESQNWLYSKQLFVEYETGRSRNLLLRCDRVRCKNGMKGLENAGVQWASFADERCIENDALLDCWMPCESVWCTLRPSRNALESNSLLLGILLVLLAMFRNYFWDRRRKVQNLVYEYRCSLVHSLLLDDTWCLFLMKFLGTSVVYRGESSCFEIWTDEWKYEEFTVAKDAMSPFSATSKDYHPTSAEALPKDTGSLRMFRSTEKLITREARFWDQFSFVPLHQVQSGSLSETSVQVVWWRWCVLALSDKEKRES